MGNKSSSSKFEKTLTKKTLAEIVHEKFERKKVKRWENIIKRFGAGYKAFERFKDSNPDKFFRYLQDGPPDELRSVVWRVALGCGKIQNIDASSHEDHKYIEKDLDRTFPNHRYFSRQKGKTALKNVLLSFANNHPELGYCQGMNSLAGIFLIVTDDQAESAAMLERLCFGCGAKSLFEYEFPLVIKMCLEFHRVLREKIPEVYEFIQRIELDDHLWLTKWFMTIFSYSFDIKCVIRIWDNIFAHGLNYMINIALGMVELMKQDLLGKTLQDMLEFFPDLKEGSVDIDLALFHSSTFQVRPVLQDFPIRSYSITQEVDEAEEIQTTWESRQIALTRSIIEEFSEIASNNISKFSI